MPMSRAQLQTGRMMSDLPGNTYSVLPQEELSKLIGSLPSETDGRKGWEAAGEGIHTFKANQYLFFHISSTVFKSKT